MGLSVDGSGLGLGFKWGQVQGFLSVVMSACARENSRLLCVLHCVCIYVYT